MKRYVHDRSTVDMLDAFQEKLDELNSSKEVKAANDFYGENEFQYELVDRKSVLDSDGFSTDYSMYYDALNDRYVFVFGDADIYTPEDEDFDWECDTEEEAREWFDNYTGLLSDEGY